MIEKLRKKKEPRNRTTVEVSPEILKMLRDICIRNDFKMRSLVEELLLSGLESLRKELEDV